MQRLPNAPDLGSTSDALSPTGAELGEQRYYPYGRARPGGSMPTDKQFTGHQEEGELYFAQARFYDPWIGQFTQPDTIVPDPGNPQSLNRYSYVGNRPLFYTDPTGRCWGWERVCDTASAAWNALGTGWNWTRSTGSSIRRTVGSWSYWTWDQVAALYEEAEAAASWVGSRSIEAGRAVVGNIRDVAQTVVQETIEFAQDVGGAISEGAQEGADQFTDNWGKISTGIQLADTLPIGAIPGPFEIPFTLEADYLAFVASQIDIALAGCPFLDTVAATALNVGNYSLGVTSTIVGDATQSTVVGIPAGTLVTLGGSVAEAYLYRQQSSITSDC